MRAAHQYSALHRHVEMRLSFVDNNLRPSVLGQGANFELKNRLARPAPKTGGRSSFAQKGIVGGVSDADIALNRNRLRTRAM
jgi:hypothetical protein